MFWALKRVSLNELLNNDSLPIDFWSTNSVNSLETDMYQQNVGSV